METWFKTDPALQTHEEIKDKILASVQNKLSMELVLNPHIKIKVQFDQT